MTCQTLPRFPIYAVILACFTKLSGAVPLAPSGEQSKMYLWSGSKTLRRHGQRAGFSTGPGSSGKLPQHSSWKQQLPPCFQPGSLGGLRKQCFVLLLNGEWKGRNSCYCFFDFNLYFLDCLWGRMCFSSKLFSIISFCLGFSW